MYVKMYVKKLESSCGKNTMITIPYSFQVSLDSVNRGDGYEHIFYMIL